MITETETAFLAVICAFLTEEKASPAEIQALTEKQWNHLFVLAAQHSLLSAVYDVVGKTPEFAELPDELRRQVKTQAMQSVLQQVSRTALFLSDEKELELLIPEKDFATVDACFMRKGFVRDKETAMPNGAKDGDAPEEMGYIHPKTGVFYEIHTRLFSTESSAYGYLNRAFSDVFAHPSRVEVQGQSIFTLEETHHLFYLLCHSFKHFLHGGVGIRQICDMVQMIRIYGRKIDWEMFWQLCEEYHMTCFCINLLDIGERYLGFSYEASGAVRAAKKLHSDSEALLIDILDAGSFGKSSAGRIHSANITLYAAETGMEKHTAGGIWKSLVPEASYMKNKYPYAARYPFLLPAAYVERILKWLGQGEKGQKLSIEVGAGRVELLKKYDMIRTADGKKRGGAHAGRIQREK